MGKDIDFSLEHACFYEFFYKDCWKSSIFAETNGRRYEKDVIICFFHVPGVLVWRSGGG